MTPPANVTIKRERTGASVPAVRGQLAFASAILALATIATYLNSFRAPFVFDDLPAIVDNTTIRHLGDALVPPRDSGVTVSGRPLVNFSLALNYRVGGTSVWGYHAVNLGIHILAGFTLFGLVRRTLALSRLRPRFDRDGTLLAFSVALLWLLHPMQTEAVTYIVQRAESLMGLFYLLTLYCFVRGVEGGSLTGWSVLAVAACVCGMASKEVMVTAPVVVLLYDRTFAAGSFREAFVRRWPVHLALVGTWLMLLLVMRESGDRGGSAGFGMGVTWWQYALTELKAVVIYLRLAVWPNSLVLDYQMPVVKHVTEVLGQMVLIAFLLVLVGIALVRRPAIGFCGAWIFLVLAPTSTVVPLADTIFEHRMYLSLAGMIALAVLAVHVVARRWSVAVLAVLALALGWATHRRNDDYRTEESIMADTVAKRPDNARARYTLGSVYSKAGRGAEALAQFAEALRIDPKSAATHVNIGNLLARANRTGEAVAHYEEALRLDPKFVDAHSNLANILAQTGRMPAALEHFATALRLRPESAEAHNNFGNALVQLRRIAEAKQQYEEALRLRPSFAEAHANLGNILAQSGTPAEAVLHYEEALRLMPDFPDAYYNLGIALAVLGRVPEAIARYEALLRLKPDYPRARENLAVLKAARDGARASP